MVDDAPEMPLLPKVVLGLIAVFVVLTVIGWVIGAIVGALRLLALVGICVAVIWAISSARGD